MEELRQLWRQGAESASLEPGIIIPSIRHALTLKLGNINIKVRFMSIQFCTGD